MLKTGIIGALVTVICCFTPVLVIGLGAVGLIAVASWLDYLLFPMLAVFLGMIAVAVIRRDKTGAENATKNQ